MNLFNLCCCWFTCSKKLIWGLVFTLDLDRLGQPPHISSGTDPADSDYLVAADLNKAHTVPVENVLFHSSGDLMQFLM